MLESKPSRNSQLETHPNEQGRRPVGIRRPFDHSDRFPDAFKTRQRKCREASFEFVIHTGAVPFRPWG
jgi:hypothetical protein